MSEKVLFRFSDPGEVKLKQAFVPILVPTVSDEGQVVPVRLVFRFDFLKPADVLKFYRSNLLRAGEDGQMRMVPGEASLAVAKEFAKAVEGYEEGLDLRKLFEENLEAQEHAIAAASILITKFEIKEAKEKSPLLPSASPLPPSSGTATK